MLQGWARGEHYYWGAADRNDSADANRGWPNSINPTYQQECNSGQRPFIYPATAGMLVAGSSRGGGHLQYDSALPGGLY